MSGSVLVLTLLALAVATLLGVSLAHVAQTEHWLGANQLGLDEVLYGADSGLAMAAVRALEGRSGGRFEVLTSEERVFGGAARVGRVRVEFGQLLATACHLCEINQDASFFRVTYRAVAVAVRRLERDGREAAAAPASTARRELGEMLSIEPWRRGSG